MHNIRTATDALLKLAAIGLVALLVNWVFDALVKVVPR